MARVVAILAALLSACVEQQPRRLSDDGSSVPGCGPESPPPVSESAKDVVDATLEATSGSMGAASDGIATRQRGDDAASSPDAASMALGPRDATAGSSDRAPVLNGNDASNGQSSSAASIRTPVCEALNWVLAVLKQQRAPTYEEVHSRFAPEFLTQVPEQQVRDTFLSSGADLSPFTLVELSEVGPARLRAWR